MSRILIAVHKFFPDHRAGTEVLTLKTAQALIERGHEVLVVSANPPDQDARHSLGPNTSDYVFDGVPVHVIEEPLRLRNYTFCHEYYHPGIKSYFERLLDSWQPDIVHVFHTQNLSASIIEAARERDIPVVFFAMDFWFVCPIVQLKRPDGTICRGPSVQAINCTMCYTPKLFPPINEVVEAVRNKYPELQNLIAVLPAPMRRIAERFLYASYVMRKLPSAVAATRTRPDALREILNKVQAILVPTKVMREIFIENGVRRELIRQVPFGIDTAPLIPFRQKTVSDTLRIGFIGTFFEHKGVDLLIEAFQSLPDDVNARLALYGDVKQFPEYGRQLMAQVDRDYPNSKKVQFAGTFPNSQLGEIFQSIDVLVVPSRWYENTPLVIQSALATKTPVIATNLGGMSELIEHGKNGLLFRLNDSNSLANQMQKLIKKRSLLEQFRVNIAEERTVSQMIDDIENVYRQIAKRADRDAQINSRKDCRDTAKVS